MWQEFKFDVPRGDLYDFGAWLSKSTFENSHFSHTYQFLKKTAGDMAETIEKPDMPNRAIAGALIARLTQFVRTYTKVPLQQIGLGSMDEFRILSLIHRLETPNRSLLSKESLMDFSTITDMLKRMEEKGWVKQVKDPNDKRSRQVTFTAAGKEFMKTVYQTLAGIQPNLLGDLSTPEQEQLIKLLMRLNEYHTNYIEKNAK